MESSSFSSAESTKPSDTIPKSPAHEFCLYGWKPDNTLTDDENYMDVVFLITRSSKNGQQGHMGSIIVRPSTKLIRTTTTTSDVPEEEMNMQDGLEIANEERIYKGILGAATNLPLFGIKECTSDIHAEISALGQACRSYQSTEGCTAYITIPPCKRCFAALVAFGIRRIVTRQVAPKLIRDTAESHGIEVTNLTREQNRSQMERINRLVNPDKSDQDLMEIAERNKLRRQQFKAISKAQKGEPQT